MQSLAPARGAIFKKDPYRSFFHGDPRGTLSENVSNPAMAFSESRG